MSAADIRQAVAGEIESNPIELHGLQWCGLSQIELAKRAGIGRTTLKAHLAGSDFDKFTCLYDGRRISLIRMADGVITPAYRIELDKRAMARAYERKTSRRVGKRDFGLLNELCKAWPPKHRVAVFRFVLRNWSQFMASYKFDLSLRDNPPEWKLRYLRFPFVPIIADGRQVALEIYITYLQEAQTGG